MRSWIPVVALVGLMACSGESKDSGTQTGSGTTAGVGAGTGSGTGGNTGTGGTGTGTGTPTSTQTSETGQCAGGPLAAPIPGCTPPPLPKTGDFGQDCVDRINQFRWECQCLPPLQRWTDAESCTDQQSADDQATNSPHGNFGVCGEWAQNTCPNWNSDDHILDSCLQMMWDEGPGEPFEEHGHYINMSSQSYTRVACGHAGVGDVWSNQNFQ